MDPSGRSFSVRSTIGQRALALVRGGCYDFAHVGGTAAIDLVMEDVEPFSERRILEVGCGLGSTAEYIRTHGWGEVTSIDIDRAHVRYASERYRNGNYICCDAAQAAQVLEPGFELVVSINSFHGLRHKAESLRGLAAVTAPGGLLRIFDLIDRDGYAADPILDNDAPAFHSPLRLEEIGQLLEANHWQLCTARPLHQQFRLWHEEFVEEIINRKKALLHLFEANAIEAQPAYAHLLDLAEQLYEATAEGRLGGAMIMATRHVTTH